MSLLLLFFPQGTAPAGIDLRDVIGRLYPALNATGSQDLTWWTTDELYNWADEAAKRLARGRGVFVERDATTLVVAATPSYALPTRHVSTIRAAFTPTGGSPATLREATVLELEALDPNWETTAGTPARYVNRPGLATVSLHKVPSGGGNLDLVFHQWPTTISSGQTIVSAPTPLGEYFLFSILAEARRKESDAAMPEVAEQLDEWVKLFEAVIDAYWGRAQ